MIVREPVLVRAFRPVLQGDAAPCSYTAYTWTHVLCVDLKVVRDAELLLVMQLQPGCKPQQHG